MKQVLHAVSLDDTRATTYTPVLMTRNRLIRDCDNPGKKPFEKVNEVWFAGAHGDVAGSYAQGALGGVSLNWMLQQTKGTGVGGKSRAPGMLAAGVNGLGSSTGCAPARALTGAARRLRASLAVGMQS